MARRRFRRSCARVRVRRGSGERVARRERLRRVRRAARERGAPRLERIRLPSPLDRRSPRLGRRRLVAQIAARVAPPLFRDVALPERSRGQRRGHVPVFRLALRRRRDGKRPRVHRRQTQLPLLPNLHRPEALAERGLADVPRARLRGAQGAGLRGRELGVQEGGAVAAGARESAGAQRRGERRLRGQVRHRRGGPQDRQAPVLGRVGVQRSKLLARRGVPGRGKHVSVLPALHLEGSLYGVAHVPGCRVQEVEGEGGGVRAAAVVGDRPAGAPARGLRRVRRDGRAGREDEGLHPRAEGDRSRGRRRRGRRAQKETHRRDGRFGRRPAAVRGPGRGRVGRAPCARVREEDVFFEGPPSLTDGVDDKTRFSRKGGSRTKSEERFAYATRTRRCDSNATSLHMNDSSRSSHLRVSSIGTPPHPLEKELVKTRFPD
mmetsp:Transcript_13440/g.56434  ORF Transcript_13440/g.56434 Transcript_13440/m.56434 type:complete len:434 (+) Transcript_13440:1531-2832(+)